MNDETRESEVVPFEIDGRVVSITFLQPSPEEQEKLINSLATFLWQHRNIGHEESTQTLAGRADSVVCKSPLD